MRILITGGFGYIGGRLGQGLSELGHSIVLGSRQETSPPDWLPQAKAVQTIWSRTSSLEEACLDVDVVIHAAGMNAQDCGSQPVAALEFNGSGTARMVEAATKAGVRKFIYLSTAHVYASPLVGSISEETCPRNLHPYATSHLAGENAVLGADQRGEIEGVVLRMSNAIGTPVQPKVNCWMLLVNDLCKQAVTSSRLILRTGGRQQRDFIPMKDVVSAITHLACLNRRDQYMASIFNLGGSTTTVLEMAEAVAERCQLVLNFRPEIVRAEPDIDSPTPVPLLRYDWERIQRTGFVPMGGIEQEIDGTLNLCSKIWA